MNLLAFLFIPTGIFGAYWRRIKGGGWWPKDQGPWWLAEGLLYVYLTAVSFGVLFTYGVVWWKALIMGLLAALLWNPGHCGLGMGIDPPREVRAAPTRPFSQFIAPLIKFIKPNGGELWCGALLSIDYGFRTSVVAAIGYFLIAPNFAVFAASGFFAGLAYKIGWSLWNAGKMPVFMQPDTPGKGNDNRGGHLIGEWINGGIVNAAFAGAAAYALL